MDQKTQNEKRGLLSFMGKKGVMIWIIALAIMGVLLILLGGEGSNNISSNEKSKELRLEEYTVSLENKIAELCSKVNGVSNVSVSVYLDSSFETVYAYDEENKSTSSGINSERKYVTIGSGNAESMVSVVEKMPNICGVAIVCSGGGDSTVSKELIGLVSSAYGIPSNKIYVAEGKK